MKKTAYILLLLAGIALPSGAQNSIDRMVRQYSSAGQSTFTSAVERDPSTRAVIKVVNTLESKNMNAYPFKQAFEKEAQTADSQLTVSKDKTTLILTTESQGHPRIYMLRYDPDNHMDVEVTIIVNFKKQPKNSKQ